MSRPCHDDRDDVAWLDAVIAFDWLPSDSHPSGFGGQLDAVAGGVRHPVGEELIDAEQGLVGVGGEAEMLVECFFVVGLFF